MRHADDALEQLIQEAGALPELARLLDKPALPPAIYEQAAALVAALASGGGRDAQDAAVKVRFAVKVDVPM
jgi:hypothetical protein